MGRTVEEEVSAPECDTVDDHYTPADIMAAQVFLFLDVGPLRASSLLMNMYSVSEFLVPDVGSSQIDRLLGQAERHRLCLHALA